MALDTDIAAARTAYLDNAGYAENDSLAEAKLFATACRKLLALPLTRTAQGGKGGDEAELDPTVIERMLDSARRFIAAKQAASDGTGVVHADFTDFRV